MKHQVSQPDDRLRWSPPSSGITHMSDQVRPLSGKRAVVSGASQGIGRGIATQLAASGADVVINYLSGHDKAKQVVQKCESYGLVFWCNPTSEYITGSTLTIDGGIQLPWRELFRLNEDV